MILDRYYLHHADMIAWYVELDVVFSILCRQISTRLQWLGRCGQDLYLFLGETAGLAKIAPCLQGIGMVSAHHLLDQDRLFADRGQHQAIGPIKRLRLVPSAVPVPAYDHVTTVLLGDYQVVVPIEQLIPGLEKNSNVWKTGFLIRLKATSPNPPWN